MPTNRSSLGKLFNQWECWTPCGVLRSLEVWQNNYDLTIGRVMVVSTKRITIQYCSVWPQYQAIKILNTFPVFPSTRFPHMKPRLQLRFVFMLGFGFAEGKWKMKKLIQFSPSSRLVLHVWTTYTWWMV